MKFGGYHPKGDKGGRKRFGLYKLPIKPFNNKIHNPLLSKGVFLMFLAHYFFGADVREMLSGLPS